MDAAFASDPTACVFGDEGRFHHSGQFAIYTSLTQEGAAVAIRRYVSASDPPRVIIPLQVRADTIEDLRHPSDLIDDPAKASGVWHDQRALGRPAPPWQYSDVARTKGAQGMLYLSRTRTDLSHFVVFDPSVIILDGVAERWVAPY